MLAAIAPEPLVIAQANDWNFELDTADWQFCNSYAHLDQTQNQNCGGNQGLWFGSNGWDNCSGAGYGNGWNDYATVTVGVNAAAGPQVQINHKFELEPGYDYAYLEVRPAGLDGVMWTTLAAYTGFSSCVTNNHTIPASVLAAGDPDGNGIATDACPDGIGGTCQPAVCGDGFVFAGIEACDDGPLNSDSASGACRTDCSLPYCGDGVVDVANGEECQ